MLSCSYPPATKLADFLIVNAGMVTQLMGSSSVVEGGLLTLVSHSLRVRSGSGVSPNLFLHEGKWTQSHTNIRRWCGTSVKFGSTLYLIGGKSERTTDIVDMSQGGEARPGFELQHDSWSVRCRKQHLLT